MKDKTQTDPISSMSLVSRLDHLDFLMKYLERKQCLAKLESNSGSSSASGELKKTKKKQGMPVDQALKESYFKGSLLDRVAALENRLFQLCLEKESSSSSSTSTQASSGDTYWSYNSNGESSYCSLPTFSPNTPFLQELHNKRLPQIHDIKSEIEEQPDEAENEPEQKKDPISFSTQLKHTKSKKTTAKANKVEDSLKTGKKRIPSISWPHLKMLGC